MQDAVLPARHHFPALTGIRAMGAAAVFFVHCPLLLGRTIVVDVMAFFFVLSGFLITYLYYDNPALHSGSFKTYFVNRFARIYPVYFLVVTVAILLRQEYGFVYLFKNYTLTHALFYNRAARAIPQSWSLTTEECFYLLAPFFLWLIRRFHFMTALLSAALMLGLALLVSFLPIPFLHTPHFVFSVSFFGHFFEFFCGIFLALQIRTLQAENRLMLSGKKYTRAGSWVLILVMGWLLIRHNMNDPARQTEFLLVNNFILPPAVALFYFGLIRERSRSAWFLSSPLLILLGKTSYVFYLVHGILIDYWAGPYLKPLLPGYYNIYVLLVFVLAQFVAWLLFRFYEEPFSKWIRKKFT